MPRKKKPSLAQQLQMDLDSLSGFPSTSLTPTTPTDRPCWKCWGPARQCSCDPDQWKLPWPEPTKKPAITWVTPPPSPLTTPRAGVTNLATSFSDILKETYKDALAQMDQALQQNLIHQTVFGTGYIQVLDAIDLAEPPTYTVCPRCAQILHNHVKIHQHRIRIKKTHIIKGWWDGDKEVGSQAHYKQEDYKTIQIYGKDYEGFKAYVEACNAEESQ